MVLLLSRQEWRQTCIVGVDCREGPPVPIPNTEVKLAGAEDTWLETARKNRFSPTQKNHLCKQVVFLWLHHRQFAGRSLSLALPGVKRQLSVSGGWLGVIGEPGLVARWLKRELRAALPLGNRLLRRKIFLGFLKIPKVFLRPFFRILW